MQTPRAQGEQTPKGNRLSKRAVSSIAIVHDEPTLASTTACLSAACTGLVCGKLKKLSKKTVGGLRILCMFSRLSNTTVLTKPNEVAVEHWRQTSHPFITDR